MQVNLPSGGICRFLLVPTKEILQIYSFSMLDKIRDRDLGHRGSEDADNFQISLVFVVVFVCFFFVTMYIFV